MGVVAWFLRERGYGCAAQASRGGVLPRRACGDGLGASLVQKDRLFWVWVAKKPPAEGWGRMVLVVAFQYGR